MKLDTRDKRTIRFLQLNETEKINLLNSIDINKFVERNPNNIEIIQSIEEGELTKLQIDKLLNAPEIVTNKDRENLRRLVKTKGIAPRPPKITVHSSANIKNTGPLKPLFEKAKKDPSFVKDIEMILAKGVGKVIKNASNQKTFCDYFIYDGNIYKQFLKLFNMNETELKKIMHDFGFHDSNRRLNQPYYQTLMICYAIGLYIENNKLRLLSLILASVKLWNATVKKQWKFGCDPEIATYAQQYLIKNNSKYKHFKTPFDFLINYFVIIKDKEFASYVRQDVADPKNGMIKMMSTLWPGINGLIVNTLAKHYYYAYENGLKVSVNSTYGSAYENGGGMVETRETIKNVTDELMVKYKKNSMIKADILKSPDVKQKFKLKFNVSDLGIDTLNKWFVNDDNKDDIDLMAEFFIQGVAPKSTEEFCLLDETKAMNMIGNAKKNEYFLKLKEMRKTMYKEIFGKPFPEKPTTTEYRYISLITFATILYIKKLTCTKV